MIESLHTQIFALWVVLGGVKLGGVALLISLSFATWSLSASAFS